MRWREGRCATGRDDEITSILETYAPRSNSSMRGVNNSPFSPHPKSPGVADRESNASFSPEFSGALEWRRPQPTRRLSQMREMVLNCGVPAACRLSGATLAKQHNRSQTFYFPLFSTRNAVQESSSDSKMLRRDLDGANRQANQRLGSIRYTRMSVQCYG